MQTAPSFLQSPPIAKQAALGLAALSIGLLLFFAMQLMIRADGALSKEDGKRAMLNFVRVDKSDSDLQTKKRQPPREPPPPETPPETPQLDAQIANVDAGLNMSMPSIGIPLSAGDGPYLGALQQGGGLAGFDTDVIPVVRVPPAYPRRAKLAKIQGSVTLAVTIEPDGTVSNAEVLEANPPRLFDEAALAAIKRWKFRPKVVDGTPVAQRAKQTIEFKLSGG